MGKDGVKLDPPGKLHPAVEASEKERAALTAKFDKARAEARDAQAQLVAKGLWTAPSVVNKTPSSGSFLRRRTGELTIAGRMIAMLGLGLGLWTGIQGLLLLYEDWRQM